MNTITKRIFSASELGKPLPASHVHVPIVFEKFLHCAPEQSKSESSTECLDLSMVLVLSGMNGYTIHLLH